MARNNRTRTTKSDDSNDVSRRRFIQGSVAAAVGILALNPSAQGEAAQTSRENNGQDDFKGKRPKPGSSEISFISLYNNSSSGTNFSLLPGPITFQDETGTAGILQEFDITLSDDNATIIIPTAGNYSIQYNATIELNVPSTSDRWFTAINVNGADIKEAAFKAPTIIGQSKILPFNGSLILSLFTSGTIQLRVAIVDGTSAWRIAPNLNGYGTATMTIVKIS